MIAFSRASLHNLAPFQSVSPTMHMSYSEEIDAHWIVISLCCQFLPGCLYQKHIPRISFYLFTFKCLFNGRKSNQRSFYDYEYVTKCNSNSHPYKPKRRIVYLVTTDSGHRLECTGKRKLMKWFWIRNTPFRCYSDRILGQDPNFHFRLKLYHEIFVILSLEYN